MGKPRSLNEIMSEKKLAEWLDLNLSEASGNSRTLGYWITRGLKCVEIMGKRYFYEQDVVDFIHSHRERGDLQG